MGGVTGKDKLRWDRTGALEGCLGEGKGSQHPKGEIGEPLGRQRIKRERGQVSPAHFGHRKLLRSWA